MKKNILIIFLRNYSFNRCCSCCCWNPTQERATAVPLLQREIGFATKRSKNNSSSGQYFPGFKATGRKKKLPGGLSYLNQLITNLNGIKKLSSVEKASLQSQIQTQIDGLNALQTKINGDTDNTTLRQTLNQ